MFIAHLPAGTLLARCHPALRARIPWVMLGSILPDADMMVFYLIDQGSTHHHSYLTHRPAIWLCVVVLGLVLSTRRLGFGLVALGLGAMLHMVLDTVVGAIAWSWPLSDNARPWVVVPATHDWWVLSFLTHWTFAVELLICLIAAAAWKRW